MQSPFRILAEAFRAHRSRVMAPTPYGRGYLSGYYSPESALIPSPSPYHPKFHEAQYTANTMGYADGLRDIRLQVPPIIRIHDAPQPAPAQAQVQFPGDTELLDALEEVVLTRWSLIPLPRNRLPRIPLNGHYRAPERWVIDNSNVATVQTFATFREAAMAAVKAYRKQQ